MIEEEKGTRNVQGKQSRITSLSLTGLGGYLQFGELRESDPEALQIALHLDEKGKARLQRLISTKAGQMLSLFAEGVKVGRGKVPLEDDVASLTFTISPDKRGRLEHAFEMSRLELVQFN